MIAPPKAQCLKINLIVLFVDPKNLDHQLKKPASPLASRVF
jgi:hypothetical protein